MKCILGLVIPDDAKADTKNEIKLIYPKDEDVFGGSLVLLLERSIKQLSEMTDDNDYDIWLDTIIDAVKEKLKIKNMEGILDDLPTVN